MTARPEAASSLSIVLPCFDEADRLPGTLAAYLAHFPPSRAEVELIVVDDGSTDGTSTIADQIAAADPRVRVVRTPHNHGKGYAVRVGVQAAQGELVVFTDADGSYGPDQLERVVAALDRAPVAIGARLGDQPGATSPLRRLASPVFNRVMRLLLGLPFSDTQCGLKGFRRGAAEAVFQRARVDGFAFDAEALLVARRLGIEVVEVPVTAEDRQGSKVRLRGDALRMLADVWKVRRAAAGGVYEETRVRDVAG
ncbi:MAG TPA: dolichyl-phosphate beta-glucosyltransferase [Actinomycetes bacterium]|jgi:dolichyl-phosphate beta-glucosyltransferase|nr:dolichyl-phosphate beta-glucosyltransferase [Actinomycetes bacterium]